MIAVVFAPQQTAVTAYTAHTAACTPTLILDAKLLHYNWAYLLDLLVLLPLYLEMNKGINFFAVKFTSLALSSRRM